VCNTADVTLLLKSDTVCCIPKTQHCFSDWQDTHQLTFEWNPRSSPQGGFPAHYNLHFSRNRSSIQGDVIPEAWKADLSLRIYWKYRVVSHRDVEPSRTREQTEVLLLRFRELAWPCPPRSQLSIDPWFHDFLQQLF
jgi:hypothetical protein